MNKYRFAYSTALLILFVFASFVPSSCGRLLNSERISYEKTGITGGTNAPWNSTADIMGPDASDLDLKIQEKSEIFNIPEKTVKRNVYLGKKNVGGMNESGLKAMLAPLAPRYATEPRDAVLNPKTWQVMPSSPGRRLNVEKTAALLLNAREGQKNGYVFETLKPRISTEQLQKNVKVIAGYTTPLLNRRSSRINNIRIASKKLDFRILKPGEEFSFNKVLGRRSAEKGYQKATIFVRTPTGTKEKDAKGGGVCQISTTIYNAARKCGLKITERHLHSKDVGYVPQGSDATVSYGTADLKFVNSRQYPIMLRFYLKKGSLTVKIIENRNNI